MKLVDSIKNSLLKMNSTPSTPRPMPNIKIRKLNGKSIEWEEFEDKYLLIVNVASNCGFTPQYKKLQALYEQYQERLEVIGVPCNQFGAQEPGSAEDIQSFCSFNFGVSFTMTEKVKVKGPQAHSLYKWLTSKEENGVKSSTVKWNFQKYLISPERVLIDLYLSTTDPTSSKITKHFEG